MRFYSLSSLLVVVLLFSIVVYKERVAVWVGSSSVSLLVTSGRTPCMLPLLHLVLFWHQLQHFADGDSFPWGEGCTKKDEGQKGDLRFLLILLQR